MSYRKSKTLPLTFAIALSVTLVGLVTYNELQATSSNWVSRSGESQPEVAPQGCDLYLGKWVLDEEEEEEAHQWPLYREEECREFMQEDVACLKNGRKDTLYQKWKWKPRDCSLPSFKAKVLLEKLKNKRLMYVGDSLNWNQWQSMVCMLQSTVPQGRKHLNVSLSLSPSVFAIQDYNATVEFAWAPYLVDSNSSNPAMNGDSNRIVMLESIAMNGAVWENVDYLIFNSYIWWMKSPIIKHLRGSLDEEPPYEYEEIQHFKAYERALRTWANWVDENVDPKRTTVLFMSMSPTHIRSTDWGNPSGIKCAMEKTPIITNSSKLPIDVGVDRRLYHILKKVIHSMKVGVELVDITALSELRKDAHPSVYTACQGKPLAPQMKANPAAFADCYHWCLPGLPDTWNQLVYARLLAPS